MSSLQVDHSHYFLEKYGSLDRFISYYYQINSLRKLKIKKILFVGVGDGVVPEYLKKLPGIELTTFDIDPALKPDVVGDIHTLPFADNTFEAIAVFEVLEHLPFEEFPNILKELKRVCSKNLVISLPCRETSFDFTFIFPGIRTLLKKDFIRILLRIPLKFGGFKNSGQHYWEIDRWNFRLSKIRSILKQNFILAEENNVVLDAYHIFFTLKK